MEHLGVRRKYAAKRRISTLLLCVAYGDETLRLMLDKLLLQNYICLKLTGSLTHFDMVKSCALTI